MFGVTSDKGITTGRVNWSRTLSNEGQDQVVAAYPIPPGSTLISASVNNLFVAHESMDIKHATSIGLHGFLVGLPQPYHGYGTNSRPALDNMWDDQVPKDKPKNDALTEGQYQDLSISDNNMQNADVAQEPVSGNFDTGSGTEMNVATMRVTSATGPECVFARERRLDVTNGIISKEDQFRAIDHVSTSIDKNYHLAEDRYWWLMFGVSTPRIEAITDLAWHPQNDYEWNALAFPEIQVMQGLLDHNDERSEATDTFLSSLESYFIDAGTYEDLGNASGLSNANNYCDLVVNYRRPQFEGLRANSRRVAG